jgi:hypothetical protein
MNYRHICKINGRSIRSTYYPVGVVHPQSIVSQKFTSSTAGKRSKMAKIANSVASLLLKK